MTQLIKLKTYSHGNVCKRARERERGRVYHKFWPESINLKQKYNNKSLDSKFRLTLYVFYVFNAF
jgi:recombinational DNA repair protein (RecF pathway)